MKSVSILGRALGLGLCAAVLSVATVAQSGSVTTGLAAGNGQSGNIFDVRNTSGASINLLTLGQNVQAAANTVFNYAVYTKVGTWVGSENNGAAWTLVGTATGVVAAGTGLVTPIPINLNIAIPAGGIQGLYVAITSGGTVGYTNGTLMGSVWATDGTLRIDEGGGRAWVAATPFSGTVFGGVVVGGASRKWNGRISYGPPPTPFWQTNQAGAGFTLDGQLGTLFSPASTSKTADNMCDFGATNIAFSSTNIGAPWDLAFTSNPAVSGAGPGFATGNGQFVNIDLGDPSLAFLNGFAFTTPFPGNFGFVFAPGAPFAAGAQFVVLDGAQLDGFSVSQPNNYTSTVIAGPPPNPAMPTGDDAAVVCTYQNTCGACTFTFYGTIYTQFGVTTNGRVMPGNNPNTSFSPLQVPTEQTIGAWCDLNTTTNGNITLSSPAAGIARVDFNAVGFFGGVVGSNGVTMGIEMDCATGNITMDNFLLASGAGQQFFGIAKGAGGTDPGPAGPFDGAALGAYGGPPGPGDNIYYFGLEGAGVINGLAALVFTPSTTGGSYDWTQY